MIKLGNFQDDILGKNQSYDLYSCKLSEIKKMILDTVQKKVVFNVNDYDEGQQSQRAVEYDAVKIPSFYHNNFIIVQGLEDGSPWLLDGFTRLFITSERVEDINVFVKSYSKTMSDDIVMKLLTSLNFWKTEAYNTNAMFDRGFCLYTYMKTGYNIKKYTKEIAYYLDARMRDSYQHGSTVVLQDDLTFNNPHIFSDIVTLCQLTDNEFNACLDKKPYKRGNKDIKFAIPFYQIVSSIRIINMTKKTNYNIDVKDASEWIQKDEELKQLAVENALSHNVTSETSTRVKSKEYFWNKYIMPNVLKMEGEKTSEEKKEEFRKMVNKEKNKYVKITYKELLEAKVGLEVFEISVNYPNFKVDKKVYMGHKDESFTYTPKIGFMSERKPRTTVSDVFMFKKEGVEKIEEVSIGSYQLNETVLILKVKK